MKEIEQEIMMSIEDLIKQKKQADEKKGKKSAKSEAKIELERLIIENKTIKHEIEWEGKRLV